MPNLNTSIHDEVKPFGLNGMNGTFALVMPEHLAVQPSGARIDQKLIDFCRTDCNPAMRSQSLRPLTDPMPEHSPA